MIYASFQLLLAEKLIATLNNAKDEFKKTMLKYKDVHNKNPTFIIRHILASAGYGIVKLLQVYRHISYIDFDPQRIAWSKSKNASYRKISSRP